MLPYLPGEYVVHASFGDLHCARKYFGGKGAGVKNLKNQDILFDHEMSVDITDAVIERMRAEASSPGS